MVGFNSTFEVKTEADSFDPSDWVCRYHSSNKRVWFSPWGMIVWNSHPVEGESFSCSVFSVYSGKVDLGLAVNFEQAAILVRSAYSIHYRK